MTKTISLRLIFYKYLIIILIGLLLYPLVRFTIQLMDSKLATIEPIVVILSFQLVLGLLLWGILSLKRIEFDSEQLIITGKNGTEKIPLQDIYGINLTMIAVNGQSFWKIKYRNMDRNEKSVRLLPNSNFEEFKEIIREKNKNTRIRTWSNSFDFDQ